MAGPQNNFQGNFANSQQNAMRSQFVGGPQMSGVIGAQQGMVGPQSYGMGSGGPMAAMPNQGMQSQQIAVQVQQQQIHQQRMLQQQQMHQQGMPSQMQQQAQMTGPLGSDRVPSNNQGGGSGSGQGPGGQIQPIQGQQSVGAVQGQGASGQTQQPQKEFNTAALCRYGQELIQDIITRISELFALLKGLPPPNGTQQSANSCNDKKHKIQEILLQIRFLFKRLAMIYQKCNDNCQLQGMDYMHIESLIPLKEEWDQKSDEKKTSEGYRMACEERREIMEQVILKNKHLKEVIDNTRRIVWEINTLLCMRRS